VESGLVSVGFLRQVDATEQAAFLVEGFDGCEETLQTFEVFLAFDCDQRVRSFASGFTPTPGDALGIRSCVNHTQRAKTRRVQQAFIFAGGTEQVADLSQLATSESVKCF
jgi:hypothetical protein